jgi:hypothetical protein
MTLHVPVRGKLERCLDFRVHGELGTDARLASPHGSINAGADRAWQPISSS